MKVVIAGCGVMGSGIGICSILAGYETLLFDINENAIEKSRQYILAELEKSVSKARITDSIKQESLSRLTFTSSPQDLVGDLILEAAVEKLEVKRKLFADLELINSSSVIF